MLKKAKLGAAPIAWTNDDMPELGGQNTYEQCISEMALAGYVGSEIGNKYPKDVKTLKATLKLRRLKIANCWFSTFLLTEPYERVEKEFIKKCKFLKSLGAKVIGISEQSYSIQGTDKAVFYEKYVLNDAEWAKFAEGLNKLGKAALSVGITMTFHHHMGTVVQTAAEIDKMMDMTCPDSVFLLFDSGHLAYAGEDYLAVLGKYINRIKHVHLKDIRPAVIEKVKKERLSFLQGVRLGTFTVPGDGAIDFTPILEKLSGIDYDGFMIVEAEQDPAIANPFEYALRANKYIKNIIKKV